GASRLLVRRAAMLLVKASFEGAPRRVMGGFFLERRIRAQGHLGSKDLRSRPCPFDVGFLEGDTAIVAVEFVLIDEAPRAARPDADAKAGKQVVEGDDFALLAGHFQPPDPRLIQP